MTTIRQAGAIAESGVTRVRTTLGRERSAEALAAPLLATPTLAVALTLLSWPIVGFVPAEGPDGSWITALYLGLEEGLGFGRELIFTYGPLGFLHNPILADEGLFLGALAYSVAIRFLVVLTLLWTARRALPLPLALIACYTILAVGHLNAGLPLVAFLLAFAALAPQAPRRLPTALVYGGAVAAAVEVLGKINFGVTVLAICLIALAALPNRRRNLALFGAVFTGSVLALWLAAGQALADLPSYISNALQVVAGYSQAMGVDVAPRPGEIAISLAAVGLLLVAVVFVTRGDRRPLRWGSAALLVLFAFLCFKQDFIRRGIDGRNEFALMIASAALAVASRRSERPVAGWSIPRAALAASIVTPAFALVVWANPQPSFLGALEPESHAQAVADSLELATDPGARASERDATRTMLRQRYAVSPAILERIGGRGVAIEPWEISAAWAYRLNWRPLPVIQDYVAYTSELDDLNAAALEGADGPATILRQNLRGDQARTGEVIDGRYPAWEGPRAKLALLCNYREALTAGEWQLLERAAGRCGPVSALGNLETSTGATIPVPTAPGPDEIVFARIGGLEPSLEEELETLAYRRPLAWVAFDGGHRWNVAAATAGDGLILTAPQAIDYARPFQLAPNPKRFSVGIDGAGSRPLTVSFYSRRVEPQRAPAAGPARVGDSR